MSNPEIPNAYGEVLEAHGMSPLRTSGYMGRLYDLAAQANRPVILNIILRAHEYDHDFETQLLDCFPNFPVHLLADIYESSTWGRGTVILPNTTDARSVAFLANYPQVQGASSSQSGPKDETISAQVNFLPILCWCSSVERPVPGSQQSTRRIAIVVTISFHECVPEKLGEFWSIERRQERLAKFEQWAFLDLAATFSGWPTIWTNARRELAQRHASMYSNAIAVADLGTTHIIHQDIANVIALREDLRLFIAAYAKYSQILQRIFPNNKISRINKMRTLTGRRRKEGQPMDEAELKERFELVELLAELENRLQDSQQNFEHQLETSEVILRQLENLLSLAFNTQAIAQGQATAMLNVLATIFLPLTFVASVFGMTKFEISAVWYPLAAAIALSLVGGAILFLRWLGVDMSMIRFPVKPASALISKQQTPTFRLLNTGPEADTPGIGAETKEQHSLDPKGIHSQESVKSALGSLDNASSLLSGARQQPTLPATLGELTHPRPGKNPEDNHSDDVKEADEPYENARHTRSLQQEPPSEKQIESHMEDTRDSPTSNPGMMDDATFTTLSYYPLAMKATGNSTLAMLSGPKSRLTKSEVELLETEFQKTRKPDMTKKREIADLLQVEVRRINNWFQNRRAKEKQSQRTRMLEAQQAGQQANAGILHGGQMTHGPEAPNTSTFGSLQAQKPRHLLQDYQMQLMLLEQQNKKRLMMARSDLDAAAAEGQSDAASGQAGKSNFSNVAGHPEPQREQRVDVQTSCQSANRLAGAGIVPAIVRDV